MEIHNANKGQREWFNSKGLTGHRRVYLLIAEFPGTKMTQFIQGCGNKFVSTNGFPFSGETAIYAELSDDDITAARLIFPESDILYSFKGDQVYIAKVIPKFGIIEKMSRQLKRLFGQKDLPWSFDK